jgi:UDP-N-acetyl-D-galactosamine dehydrogenase
MQNKIAIIGLGYVGLPLARLFATKYHVVGYDINKTRVDELMKGKDRTFEITANDLMTVLVPNLLKENGENQVGLYCTNIIDDIKGCNVYIVTVPTPIDKNKHPDLTPLLSASRSVGKALSKGDTVIYESTVFPGATEENCVPVLEQVSGLKFNRDFFTGYSPERINPGDKKHTVEKILKVTSGSTPEIAGKIDALYQSVITAGTYLAPSIKVAEAAKVIENSQRDINIAFVNELAKIFNRLNIDTNEVLKAAGTKWNFLQFKPGLVGGHCIGVDPYYLDQKAQENDYHPEIILAGRRTNDGMGKYVASELVKIMIKKGKAIKNATVAILGFTFKENCPDIRNTRTIDIYNELQDYGMEVVAFDPIADSAEVTREYSISINSELPQEEEFDAMVLAVSHEEFTKIDFLGYKNRETVIYDVKGFLNSKVVAGRL